MLLAVNRCVSPISTAKPDPVAAPWCAPRSQRTSDGKGRFEVQFVGGGSPGRGGCGRPSAADHSDGRPEHPPAEQPGPAGVDPAVAHPAAGTGLQPGSGAVTVRGAQVPAAGFGTGPVVDNGLRFLDVVHVGAPGRTGSGAPCSARFPPTGSTVRASGGGDQSPWSPIPTPLGYASDRCGPDYR
jgi:hypothetical protein